MEPHAVFYIRMTILFHNTDLYEKRETRYVVQLLQVLPNKVMEHKLFWQAHFQLEAIF